VQRGDNKRRENFNYPTDFALHEIYFLSGGDIHVSAEFSCTSDADCTIRGSFFFEPNWKPQAFSAGKVVQLNGIEMQEWNGAAQLSGRNVQIIEYSQDQNQTSLSSSADSA
jgi:hypothetical protein